MAMVKKEHAVQRTAMKDSKPINYGIVPRT